MFRQGAGNAKAAASDSDSDWDTTVDFPTPRHGATGNDTAPDSGGDDAPPAQPTPKSRSTVTAKGDTGLTVETPAYNGSHDDGTPASARWETKTPASASAIRLSARDSGPMNPSPAPPYGFKDALTNDDGNRPSPSPVVRETRGGGRYDPSTIPRIPPTAMDAPPISNWDDSDAEQQTLREIHTNLKKEKTKEIQNEAARRQIQDEGDHSSAAARPMSQLEKWMQTRDDKQRQKSAAEGASQSVMTPGRKHGVNTPPPQWSAQGMMRDNVAPGVNYPYQSLVVKDPDGNRYLYYFSEGSTAFYEVEEEESEAVMPKVAEKVEGYVKRGWQEVFGVLRIVTSILIYLVVEALNYATNHLAQPLVIGVLTMVGNRLVKPLLAGVFNLVLQPVIIFSWNFASGLRHVSQPLIDIIGGVMSKLAVLLQAFRLVEVNLGSDYLQGRLREGGGGGRGQRDIQVV